jgi:DNA-binding response OmpR family regulator
MADKILFQCKARSSEGTLIMPAHILIIDDDRDICTVKKAQLELNGDFQVTVADGPHKGLKLAKSKKPDLILLDIIMPGKDGFEVLNELKSDIQTATIPVIMHTGVDESESRERAAELYNEDYVLKTADRATLIGTIQKVLSRRNR